MRDYAEQVKRLRNQAKLERYYHGSGKICDDAADAIEELVVAVPKWHPVSDPPKEPGQYICVVESQIWKGGYYAEVLTFSHGFFHDVGIRDDVAYWMPLPNPPKEDANENHS